MERFNIQSILVMGITLSVFSLIRVTSQAQTVGGTVTDMSGQPLVGTSIVIKGTNTGDHTNQSGSYSLSVPSLQDTLVFSFIGYQIKTVPINGRSTINITLQRKARELNETVVIGYGSTNKANLITSVSQVTAEDLNTSNPTSIGIALAGKVPGVRVQQTTGAPGGGLNIRIRGVGSINAGNDPLYVINGVPLSNSSNSFLGMGNGGVQTKFNPLASLDVKDIKSINLLKGPAATSIYGSRGANGVIVIETKQGIAGHSQIEFSANFGWQNVSRKIPMLSKDEYLEKQLAGYDIGWAQGAPGRSLDDPYSMRGNNTPPKEYLDPSQLTWTSWQDAVYQVAPTQKYTLSASGGSENIQYYLSGNLKNLNGLVVNSYFKSYGFFASINGDVSDHISVGMMITPTYSTRNLAHQAGIAYYGGVATTVLSQNPFYPVYDENGNYSYFTTFHRLDGKPYNNSYANPVGASYGVYNAYDHFHALGNIYLKINFTKHLSLKSSLNGDFNFYNKNHFQPSYVSFTGRPPVRQSGNSFNARDIQWDNRNLLEYKNQFGKHRIDVLLGLEEQKTNYLRGNLSARDFPNDRVQTLNAGIVNGGSTTRSAWTLMSYFGRVEYNYNNKYLAQITMRRDGSSRFGASHKWGWFPSGAFGWRIDQENFIKDVPAISTLKLRVEYGIQGNNSIGNYAAIGLVSQSTFPIDLSGNLVPGLYQSSLSNNNLTWEKAREFDIGLNLGLFNDRIFFTGDYYNRITSDLLLQVNLPLTTGYNSTIRNLGVVRNRGIEINLETVNIQTSKFRWKTSFNFALNKNIVVDMNGQTILTQDYNFYNPAIFITKEGLPIGSYWGYIYQGIFKNKEEVINDPHFPDVVSDIAQRDAQGNIIMKGGKPVIDPSKVYIRYMGGAKFKDLNGDGIITPDDKAVIGDNFPDFTYGMSSQFSYKGLTFRFSLQGEKGAQVMQLLRRSAGYREKAAYFKNYWRSPENPGDGQTWAPTGSAGHNREPSSFFVENASFLRINNVQLSYQLPQRLLPASGFISGIRIYANVRNLYTFTDYQEYNPQVRSGNSYGENNTIRPGLAYGAYPVPRILSIGIDAKF